MPRHYYRCSDCQWQITWAFVPGEKGYDSNPFWKNDPDIGLIIGGHIEACHPELLYGPLIPASILRKTMALMGANR